MKFINYLESITGISIFPMISLVIFVTFFCGVAYYVYATPKKVMDEKSQIPLETN